MKKLFLALAMILPLTAQAKDLRGTFSIVWENDIFGGTDEHYTNGARFSWFSSEQGVPKWLDDTSRIMPFFDNSGDKRFGFALGQSMFTPRDIAAEVPDPNDRPYAGWLYGSATLLSDLGSRLDTFQLSAGVVGPSSLAEQVQKEVHAQRGNQDPRGWSEQIEDEPGFILTYERKYRNLYEFSPFGLGADFVPHVGLNVGNVRTDANMGFTVRIGRDLPSDYGPPRIRPSLGGTDYFEPNKSFGWYLFASSEGRAVAHDIFLDGSLFRTDPSVDKNILVGSVQAGAAVTIGRLRFAYTHVFVTEEFKNQQDPSLFGAFTVSTRF